MWLALDNIAVKTKTGQVVTETRFPPKQNGLNLS